MEVVPLLPNSMSISLNKVYDFMWKSVPNVVSILSRQTKPNGRCSEYFMNVIMTDNAFEIESGQSLSQAVPAKQTHMW